MFCVSKDTTFIRILGCFDLIGLTFLGSLNLLQLIFHLRDVSGGLRWFATLDRCTSIPQTSHFLILWFFQITSILFPSINSVEKHMKEKPQTCWLNFLLRLKKPGTIICTNLCFTLLLLVSSSSFLKVSTVHT